MTPEQKGRLAELVDVAIEFGQPEAICALIEKEWHSAVWGAYAQGYRDAKAQQPDLSKQVEKRW